MRSQPGAHRIHQHVAAQASQVRSFFDELSLEPSLVNVSDAGVSAIPPLPVPAVQVAHRAGNVWFRRAEYQVRVIRHRAYEPQLEPEALDGDSEQLLVTRIVQIVQEDARLVVPSRHRVVGEAGHLNSKWSRHARPQGENRAN